jgi:hypothetical protein
MTNKSKKTTKNASLSSENLPLNQKNSSKEDDLKELQQKVFDAINNLELQKSLDRWIRQESQSTQAVKRDFSMLKDHISEYLDSFLILGYTMEGERIVIQAFKTAKDRDAIVEFLKTIFIKQQNENFLDE